MSKKYIYTAISLFIVACGSYYSKQVKLFKAIINKNYDLADQILAKQEKSESKGRNKILYWMNKGSLTHLEGKYEESNEALNIVDELIEDQTTNVGDILLKYLMNPMMTDYTPEDHEIFFVHYYKALNYLQLGEFDEALVECRRLNTQLNVLDNKYKGEKNVYSKDAFAHNLMGIVYQASGDYNNAFIAYRNAVEIYESSEYKKMFNLKTPLQLKKDLIYSAYCFGDYESVDYYKERLGMKDYHPENEPKNVGDVICFWNDGLCPIKQEFSINFAITRIGDTCGAMFVNEKLGLAFPFPANTSEDLFDLQVIRIAFPKYIERSIVTTGGSLYVDEHKKEFEIIEDVNKIAFKVLDQRMHKELGSTLLRFALKKTSEMLIRKSNKYVGLAYGLFNASVERADTRNWQLLPYRISYNRVKLPSGTHTLRLKPQFSDDIDPATMDKYDDDIREVAVSKKHNTQFIIYNTIH